MLDYLMTGIKAMLKSSVLTFAIYFLFYTFILYFVPIKKSS